MPGLRTWVVWWLASLPLLSQVSQPEDSRTLDPGDPSAQGQGVLVNLVFEVFTLPLSEAAPLQRSMLDDGSLYEAVIERQKQGKARQDLFQSVVAESGKEAEVSDGSHMIYPTWYEPPGVGFRLPNMKAYDEFMTPPTPTAWQFTHLGWSCSMRPQVDPKTDLVQLRVTVRMKEFLKNDIWGDAPCQHQIPRFSVASLKTELPVVPGEVTFLGTVGEDLPPNGEAQLRLAFVTAELPGRKIEAGEPERWRLSSEVFSLSITEAGHIQRTTPPEDRYRAVLQRLDTGKVRLDGLFVVSVAEGRPGRLRDTEVFTYPYEYIPPPGSLSRPKRKPWDASPRPRAIPRNLHYYGSIDLGETMDAMIHHRDDGRASVWVDANEVRLLKRHSFAEGMARVEMPEFGKQGPRMEVALEPGKAILLGTSNRVEKPEEVRWVFLTARKSGPSLE